MLSVFEAIEYPFVCSCSKSRNGSSFFLSDGTPRKENKRCHLTTGETQNERPRGHIGSRKFLDYDSVEQNNKVSFHVHS